MKPEQVGKIYEIPGDCADLLAAQLREKGWDLTAYRNSYSIDDKIKPAVTLGRIIFGRVETYKSPELEKELDGLKLDLDRNDVAP